MDISIQEALESFFLSLCSSLRSSSVEAIPRETHYNGIVETIDSGQVGVTFSCHHWYGQRREIRLPDRTTCSNRFKFATKTELQPFVSPVRNRSMLLAKHLFWLRSSNLRRIGRRTDDGRRWRRADHWWLSSDRRQNWLWELVEAIETNTESSNLDRAKINDRTLFQLVFSFYLTLRAIKPRLDKSSNEK